MSQSLMSLVHVVLKALVHALFKHRSPEKQLARLMVRNALAEEEANVTMPRGPLKCADLCGF